MNAMSSPVVRVCTLVFAFLVLAPAVSGKVPGLVPIPDTLPEPLRSALASQRQQLVSELGAFQAAADAFNAKKAGDQSDAEYYAILARQSRYVTRATVFNVEVNMDALALRLGWAPTRIARLDVALHSLRSDGDPNATKAQVVATWTNVLGRGEPEDLVREASQGTGLGFAGAGTQTRYEDCAVFALANATGLPYGVVASRAGELIRSGPWRTDAERADPGAAIAGHGLTGGEIIMLSESFGQADVVPSGQFARTLAEGRPIMINVVPSDGNMSAGHEVVVTKSFQHNGETWFALMDSNQGPQRRLFLSQKELGVMLQENGDAFRP